MSDRIKMPLGFSFALLAAGGLLACSGGKTERAYVIATGGNWERGRQVIELHDCGTCHTIPGIRSARGKVAPPLNFFGQRTFIAGAVPNSPENLVQWVMEPKSIEPHTAMPDLGLEEQEARDVAAYLYTLDR